MPLERSLLVYELVRQPQRRPDGLLTFEYRVWESQTRRDAGDAPVFLNSHRAQVREEHQRIQRDAQGRFLHQSGAAVAAEDLEAFLEDPPPGGPYPPFLWPNYWGVEEELDGQWHRETYEIPAADQVAEHIGRFMDRAETLATRRFGRGLARGRTVDFRGTTLNLQVGASADDAFQATASDVVTIDGLSGLVDAATEHYGARFQGVTISGAATIDAATFTVFITSTLFDEPQHQVRADDADNAAVFTTAANSIDGRSRTTAVVQWNSADLGASADAAWEWGAPNGSPTAGADLDTIIQEVIDRGGWASGNSIVLIFEQHTLDAARDLSAYFYDSDSAKASKLDIDYTGGAVEVGLAGNQPNATGSEANEKYLKTLAGNQPAATGAEAEKYLIARAGAQPNATGALIFIRIYSVALAGAQPAATGTLAQKYLIALAGAQPAPSGTLTALQTLARTLAGAQPAPSGALSTKYLIALAGAQPAATGTIAAATLIVVALAGAQPAPSGTLAFIRIYYVALAGAQPNATGALTFSFIYSVALAGSQPNATGALTALQTLAISLAGTQPNATGALAFDIIPGGVTLSGSQPNATGTLAALQTLAIALAGSQPNATGSEAAEKYLLLLAGAQPNATGSIAAIVTPGTPHVVRRQAIVM